MLILLMRLLVFLLIHFFLKKLLFSMLKSSVFKTLMNNLNSLDLLNNSLSALIEPIRIISDLLMALILLMVQLLLQLFLSLITIFCLPIWLLIIKSLSISLIWALSANLETTCFCFIYKLNLCSHARQYKGLPEFFLQIFAVVVKNRIIFRF